MQRLVLTFSSRVCFIASSSGRRGEVYVSLNVMFGWCDRGAGRGGGGQGTALGFRRRASVLRSRFQGCVGRWFFFFSLFVVSLVWDLHVHKDVKRFRRSTPREARRHLRRTTEHVDWTLRTDAAVTDASHRNPFSLHPIPSIFFFQ